MQRPVSILRWLALFTLLCLTFIAPTAPRVAAQVSDSWTGEYFNNTTLSGSSALVRQDGVINFQWGLDSPGPGVNADGFSVRWSRSLRFDAATYRFSARTDDGVRVYLDGARIIDAWYNRTADWSTSDQFVSAGVHTVTVEYYDDVGDATAEVGWFPTDSGSWSASFYDNTTLSGSADVTRSDSTVDFDWGSDSPASGISKNDWSARWTRTFDLPAGTYRFILAADDGARLFVGGDKLIDRFSSGSAIDTAVTTLTGGSYEIKVEYVEFSGDAHLSLSWEYMPGGTGGAWTASYYSNNSLSGDPGFIGNFDQILFNWGSGSPSQTIPADNFSARYTGSFTFESGTYRFTLAVDDGARLLVDGVTIIDEWHSASAVTYTADRSMTAGTHSLELQYQELSGDAQVSLTWAKPGAGGAPVPAPSSAPPPAPSAAPAPGTTVAAAGAPPAGGISITIDETDPARFVWAGGRYYPWTFAVGGAGSRHLWVFNRQAPPLQKWGRWNVFIEQPGYYDIYAYIPADAAATTNARYRVYSGSILSDVIAVNQRALGNQWAYLGRFYFAPGGSQFTYLNNITGEANDTTHVLYDQVHYVYAGS
jgi:hypothetical protein